MTKTNKRSKSNGEASKDVKHTRKRSSTKAAKDVKEAHKKSNVKATQDVKQARKPCSIKATQNVKQTSKKSSKESTPPPKATKKAATANSDPVKAAKEITTAGPQRARKQPAVNTTAVPASPRSRIRKAFDEDEHASDNKPLTKVTHGGATGPLPGNRTSRAALAPAKMVSTPEKKPVSPWKAEENDGSAKMGKYHQKFWQREYT